jgi:hypothetical protein
MICAAMTPLSSKQQSAVTWLEDYANAYGDFVPNGNQIFLSAVTRKDIYEHYFRDLIQFNNPTVSLTVFEDLWRNLFPHVLLRQWCSIPGKCDTCNEIDTIRRKSAVQSVNEAAKEAHVLHRGGFFMFERQAYQSRKLIAEKNSGNYMSLVIDGMDQSHSRFPHLPLKEFKDPLHMHVQGVLEHGSGKYYF